MSKAVEDLKLVRYHLQQYGHIPANIEYPSMSMTEMMLESCNKNYDRTANKYQMNGLEYTESYVTLAENIERIAKLMKLSDVKKGEKVVAFLPDLPITYSTIYGVLATGAVLVPLHPKEPKDQKRTAEKLRLTNPSVIICLDSNIKDLDEILKNNPDINKNVRRIFYTTPVDSLKKTGILSVINPIIDKKYASSSAAPAPYTPVSNKFECLYRELKSAKNYLGSYMENVKGEDDAEILFTSGTSGRMPTGCLHTHNSFNHLAIAGYHICDMIKPGQKVIAVPGIFHGFGGVTATHTLFNSGTTRLNVPDPTNFEYLAQILKKESPEIEIYVPAILKKMKDSGIFDDVSFENTKLFISGGAKMGADTYQYWYDKVPCGIREGYGNTQTLGGTCINLKDKQVKGSMGIPLSDYYYAILDTKTGKVITEPNKPGELIISGPSIMRGTINNQTNNGLFTENGRTWFRTNDLVYRDADGFYWYIDRIDDIINLSNGNLVNPFYIREIFEEFGVENVVIFKKTDGKTEEDKIVACFESTTGEEQAAILVERIKARFKNSNLKSYEVPSEIVILDRIPMSLNGKVEAKNVREKYEGEQYVMKYKTGA